MAAPVSVRPWCLVMGWVMEPLVSLRYDGCSTKTHLKGMVYGHGMFALVRGGWMEAAETRGCGCTGKGDGDGGSWSWDRDFSSDAEVEGGRRQNRMGCTGLG